MLKKATLMLFVTVIVLAVMPLSMTVSAQNPDCEGDVTLTYWHHWGGPRIPLMEAQIAAFEDANPGICVDNIFLPWDNRLQNLLTAIAPQSPDVTCGRGRLTLLPVNPNIIPLDDTCADGYHVGNNFFREFCNNQ